ncbi:carbon storage regulator CsrA [candidate division KSB1 bacterium]|nr:carbon storage regulator CsrA [candidate division KSB1 bacterium]
MLILTRKLNESIIIGDNIVITVVEIDKGHIRLGVQAPKDIAVHRKEIFDRIQEENVKAASSKKADLLKFSKEWQQKIKQTHRHGHDE